MQNIWSFILLLVYSEHTQQRKTSAALIRAYCLPLFGPLRHLEKGPTIERQTTLGPQILLMQRRPPQELLFLSSLFTDGSFTLRIPSPSHDPIHTLQWPLALWAAWLIAGLGILLRGRPHLYLWHTGGAWRVRGKAVCVGERGPWVKSQRGKLFRVVCYRHTVNIRGEGWCYLIFFFLPTNLIMITLEVV